MTTHTNKTYIFCGIGGSGMMPLALILKAQGATIIGTDRAYDQGQSLEKFGKLKTQGIQLAPQDGSAFKSVKPDALIVSAAIEDTIPDVKAAKEAGIKIITRPQLLSSLFNSYDGGISIAGTSGKSTVTGMTATIFDQTGQDPTLMNGGFITNLNSNMRAGKSDVFITETCESDGSIALYNPAIALVNNIALDHMPLEDLKDIFTDFTLRARKAIILNADDAHSLEIIEDIRAKAKVPVLTFGITNKADLKVEESSIEYRPDGVSFTLEGQEVNLNTPGRHNILNALAALAIAKAHGIALDTAIKALETFTGIARRMQVIGTRNGVTVIDDFGHNPDKIAASLQTLKQFKGRIFVIFQAHGFAPLRLMGEEIVESFTSHLTLGDQLLMPEVYYAGGTVDRSVTAKDIICKAAIKGVNAHWFEDRAAIKMHLKKHVRPSDRVIIMGARDDTLTTFAREILDSV